MLRANGMQSIIGCDTVRAVSAVQDEHSDDIILIIDKSDARRQGQGRKEHRVHLHTLRSDLQDVFRTEGNTHWGDTTDARLLTEALDTGFCMFADRLELNGNLGLVSLDLLRGDFPYFIPIWWSQPSHFRALEIRFSPTEPFQVCWSQPSLPASLVEQYNISNSGAPVSSQANRASGIS